MGGDGRVCGAGGGDAGVEVLRYDGNVLLETVLGSGEKRQCWCWRPCLARGGSVYLPRSSDLKRITADSEQPS